MLIMSIIIIFLIFYAIFVYNSWITLKEAVVNNFKAIGVQLDERGKIIDSFVVLSKQYLGHENNIFVQLAELRALSKTANTPHEKQEVESKIDHVLKSGGINITVENYPELKSDKIFIKNQEMILSEEQKLMYSKRSYNNSIEDLRVSTEKFPNVIFLGLLGRKATNTLEEYKYWDISVEKRNAEEEKRFS